MLHPDPHTTAHQNTAADPISLAICVATFMRPNMLANCLAQLAVIRRPENLRIVLSIVDNDAAGSAQATLDASPAKEVFETRYAVEPERGLSQVRNRCLQEAIEIGASLLAFIDDDEFPHPDWLVTLVQARANFQAKIVQAPVIQVPWAELEEIDLSQLSPKNNHPTGSAVTHVNAGNVLFDLAPVIENGLRFDPFFQFVAGEDHDFFDRLVEINGHPAIWCAEALTYETVAVERLNLSGRLERAFTGGIANVAKFRHRHSWPITVLYFLNKSLSKLLAGSVKVLAGTIGGKKRLHTGLRDWATAAGYLAGMTGQQAKTYRTTDGQ